MSLRPPDINKNLNQDELETLFGKYLLRLERRNLILKLKDVVSNRDKDIQDEDIFKVLILSLQIDSSNGKDLKSDAWLNQSNSLRFWARIVDEFDEVDCVVDKVKLFHRWLKISNAFKLKMESFKGSRKPADYEFSNIDLQIIYYFPTLLNNCTPKKTEKRPFENHKLISIRTFERIDVKDNNKKRKIFHLNDTIANTLQSIAKNREFENNVQKSDHTRSVESTHSVHKQVPEVSENVDQTIINNDVFDKPDINIILSSDDEVDVEVNDDELPLSSFNQANNLDTHSSKNKEISNINVQTPGASNNNASLKDTNDVISDYKAFRTKNKYQPFHKLSLHNLPRNHWSNWWKNRKFRCRR